MGDTIKYLYDKFLLRDLLSFITPGAIITFTALYLFLPEGSLFSKDGTLLEHSRSIHWLLYIPIFGVLYMVGFSVQCFGRIIGLIRSHRLDESSLRKRLRIFGCNWAGKFDMGWEKANKQVVQFYKDTQRDEYGWARQEHERLVVLKQMCANGSFAIAISAFLILINLWSHQASLVLVSIVAFFLLVSLFWGYRHAERGLDITEDTILRILNKGKKES